MAEKDLELNLLLKGTVTPSVQKVLDANAAFKKDLSEMKGIAKDLRLDPFKDLALQVVRQRTAVESLNDEYRQLDRQLRESGEGAEVAARKYLQLLDAQQQLSATEAALQQQMASGSSKFGVGQAGNAISGVSRGLGAVGFTGAASQLNAVGDLFDLAEGAKKITEEAPSAIKNLAEAAGGFKKLALGAGAVGLAAAAATGAMYLINEAREKEKKRIEELQAAHEEYADAIVDTTLLIQSATSEQVQTEIDRLDAENKGISAAQKRLLTATSGNAVDFLKQLKADLNSPDIKMRETAQATVDILASIGGISLDNLITAAEKTDKTVTLSAEAMQPYQDKIAELSTTYQANEDRIDLLKQSLEGTTVAANDSAAAVQKATEAYQQQTKDLQADTQKRIEYAQRDRTWTTEQVNERLQTITETQAAYDAERQTLEDQQKTLEKRRDTLLKEQVAGEDVTAELQGVNDQLGIVNTALAENEAANAALAEETTYLTDTTLKAAEARQIEAAAMERFKELAEETKRRAEEEAEAQQKALDLQADYAAESEKIEANHTTTSLREQEDWERQQAISLAKHYADLAALDEQFYDSQAQLLETIAAIGPETAKAEAKALAEYHRDSQKLARDHKNKMLDIQHSLENGQAEAVEDRSISAAIEAVRAAKQQAEAENQQYAEEKERRDEDYQLRLAELKEQRDEKLAAAQKDLDDLRAKHQKERTAKIQAYQQEQALAAENRRITLQRQREDWQREDTERQQHLTQQLNKLGMHNTNVATATGTHYKNLEVIHAAGMRKIETAVGKGYDRLVKNLDSLAAAAGNAKQLTASSGGEVSAPQKYARSGTPKPFSIGTVGDGGGPENVLFMGYNRVFPNDFNLKQLPMGGDTYQFQFTVQGGGALMDEQRLQSFFETRIIPRITTAIQQKRGVSR